MPYLHCHHCKARWEGDAAPALGAVCGKCGKDLRCCKNCRNHAAGYPNECMETRAEPVEQKDRATLCEFYLTGVRAGGNAPHHTPTQKKAIEAFAALFGGDPKKPG